MHKKPQTQPLLLRQPEACRLLGVSKHTLRLLIADGHLKTVKLRPGAWPRVTRKSIDELMERARHHEGRVGYMNDERPPKEAPVPREKHRSTGAWRYPVHGPRERHRLARQGAYRGQPRWGDDLLLLDDDELLLNVRGQLAVDRAVNAYRGKRWPVCAA
jgi:excisionase family DNA binding protein